MPTSIIDLESGVVFSVDAVLTENHSFKSNVTQFPIEDGSTISDHIYNEPESVTMAGIVTTTPIIANLQANPAQAAAAASAVQTALAMFLLIRDTRRPITLITNLQRYENMVLTQLMIPRDKANGKAAPRPGVIQTDSMRFTAEFVSIKIVGFASFLAKPQPTPAAGKAGDQAKANAELNKQAQKPLDKRSAAMQVLEFVVDKVKGFDGGAH